MREEYWRASLLLLVVGSWVLGVAYGRWLGGADGFFIDLSQVVRVPSPLELDAWWQPFVYFTLTVVAFFVLSQLFFGVGAVVFLFARGVYDGTLMVKLEGMVRGWSWPNIPPDQLWLCVLFVLILAVNLPLCLWAAHMGTQRAVYMWYRITGKPVKPEIGMKPLSNFLLILAISIVAGLIAALVFSYT